MVQYLPMKFIVSIAGFGGLFFLAWFILQSQTATPIVTAQRENSVPTVAVAQPPAEYVIPQQLQVNQTFNNCGPASLSMLFSYQGKNISQDVLGKKLRPYQNQQGDNDDKSVTVEELSVEAKNYSLLSYHRPHGSMTLIKTLIANDIPVLVRTWLSPDEDIGHYRIVRGYDDTTKQIIQDDSYEGADLRQSYDVFLEMWQPFNYEYMIVVSPYKKQLVEQILKTDTNKKTAWINAYNKAVEEAKDQPENPYPIFNQSVALFHLGKYEQARDLYESVQFQLPWRMLWYQTEPIESYVKTGNYEQVFTLTDQILSNENRGFSELYLMRAESYKQQGDIDAARAEINKAIYYNNNLASAKEALQQLNTQ